VTSANTTRAEMLRRTPADVRALTLPGERVLSWARVAGPATAYAVATDQALYIPVPEPLRLPWELIAKATWGEGAIMLIEGRVAPAGINRTWRVRIDEPGAFPTLVYERVTSSVVVSEHVALMGDAGIRIVARRAGDGFRWTVTFDPGLDPDDPQIRRRADAALADLRSTLGV